MKTFKEWKRAGYHVVRGQKATGRNARGDATFTSSQVAKSYNFPSRPVCPRRYRKGDWQRGYGGYGTILPYPIVSIP